jgi:hypothetical protein
VVIDPAWAFTGSLHYKISNLDCKVRMEAFKIATAGAIIGVLLGQDPIPIARASRALLRCCGSSALSHFSW